METIQLIAKNPKNQSKVNRCIKSLERYYFLNDLRDKSSDNEDEKGYRKYNRMCEQVFDKYLTYLDELPKYEQALIEKL